MNLLAPADSWLRQNELPLEGRLSSMLSFYTSSLVMRREVDPSTCLLYQAKPGFVCRILGSPVAPPQDFEQVSREIPELVCSEKDELAWCTGLRSAGVHQ